MKAMRKRHSVRQFKPARISQRFINKTVKLASTAPSAGNLKAYEYKVIQNKDRIKEVAELSNHPWIKAATLIFAVNNVPAKSASKYGSRGMIYSIQDATIFLTYLDLLCVEVGYGTCWVGGYDYDKVPYLTMLVVGGK